MNVKSIILLIISAILFSSCEFLDTDMEEKFSFEDPLFLGINEVLVSCNGSRIANQDVWTNEFDGLLNDYRINGHKLNYSNLASSGRERLCGLVKFLEIKPASFESYSNNEKLAIWINTYHLMMVNLIAEGYGQVNEPGKPQKPEFRSPLNIGNKGLKVFEEFKWLVFGAYRSLDQVEEEIDKLVGFKSKVSLYRGMVGFGPLPEQALIASNVHEYLNEGLYKMVNESIFYDDLSSPPTAFVPGSLELYMNDLSAKETSLRKILAESLDQTVWGAVLSGNDLLIKEDAQYKWTLSFDPINWQLAE